MDIKVGASKARGTIFLSGNKNSALPVIAASILWPGKVELFNIPDIVDVRFFLEFLESIGVGVDFDTKEEHLKLDYTSLKHKNKLYIDNPGKLSKIRAVILLLAALVVRFKKVRFGSSFSGCNLGARPLTVHFNNLKKLGFNVEYSLDRIEISTKNSLFKENVDASRHFLWQKELSVTGTEVALIAATFRPGKTVIYNAAAEPHVQDTGYFLQKMGYKIKGLGTNLVEIESSGALDVKKYASKTIKYNVYSDHHEYATWLSLGAITGGDVKVVHNILPTQLNAIDRVYGKFGFDVKHRELTEQDLANYKRSSSKVFQVGLKPASAKIIFPFTDASEKVKPSSQDTKPVAKGRLYVTKLVKRRSFMAKPEANGYIQIKPGPWPSFPVDLLSLFIPLAAYSNVPVLFHNWMYDGGLFWTLELRKAGVSVVMLDPHRVIVKKDAYKTQAHFEAPYIIRATIALLMYGASMPKGATIQNADAAFRGHPWFLEKLSTLGIKVEKGENNNK